MNPCNAALRLARLMFSSTTRPSTWWNIGVCVRSESHRYTRPGAITRNGGLLARMARICTGEVCVRGTAVPKKNVSCIARAG